MEPHPRQPGEWREQNRLLHRLFLFRRGECNAHLLNLIGLGGREIFEQFLARIEEKRCYVTHKQLAQSSLLAKFLHKPAALFARGTAIDKVLYPIFSFHNSAVYGCEFEFATRCGGTILFCHLGKIMVVANLLYAVGEFLGCRTLLHIAYYKMGGDVGIHIGEGE